MLLVQKYNSLAEIEAEFKDAVEALISPEIPYLSFLERAEKDKPKEHTFYYYLFFGQSSNMPVGFAMMELVTVPEKEFTPIMDRMMNKLRKKACAKWLRFGGPSRQKTFFFFEPKHQKAGLIELSNIIKEMKVRDDVVVIEEWISAASHTLLPPNDKKSFKSSQTVLAPLKKSFKTYEDYFSSLSEATSKLVKSGWKSIMKDKEFTIADNVALNKIPSHHKLKYYHDETLQGQVIEDNKGPLAALLFIEAKNKHMHVDVLQYKDMNKTASTMLLQSALMRFFEKENVESLNFLDDLGLAPDELKELGLTPMTLEQSLEARSEHAKQVLKQDDLRRYS